MPYLVTITIVQATGYLPMLLLAEPIGPFSISCLKLRVETMPNVQKVIPFVHTELMRSNYVTNTINSTLTFGPRLQPGLTNVNNIVTIKLCDISVLGYSRLGLV